MKLLVTRFEPFPHGTATAFRAFTLCKMLADIGYEVVVISPKLNEPRERRYYLSCDHRIKAYSNDDFNTNSFEDSIVECIKEEKPSVVLRSTTIKYFRKVNKYIVKKMIPLVYDSVEWYDSTNWRLGRFDPRYWYFQYLWRVHFPKAQGIIAISRMIEQHYRRYLDNVVRIPTIIDCSSFEYSTEVKDESTIRFIFAGKLDNNKDRLVNFVQAIDKLNEDIKRVHLDIYGPSNDDLKNQFGKYALLLERHKDIIKTHGLVDQEFVRAQCKESDYSVFFRLNRRSANAGFPTKLGECMSAGTPVFCNNTGDISLVVKDKINGILLSDGETETIYNALRYVLSLSSVERRNMRSAARNDAVGFFDYNNYINELKRVIEVANSNRGPENE